MTAPSTNPTSPTLQKRSRLAVTSLWLCISAIVLFVLLLLSLTLLYSVGSKHGVNTFLDALPLSLFLLFGIAGLNAIGFGFAALVVIKRSHGRLSGLASAISGICMGSVILVIFITELCRPVSSSPRGDMAWERLVNMDQLNSALRRYKHDKGHLPPSLSSLVPEYVAANDAGVFFGPTNYPRFVKTEFRQPVKSAGDARLAITNGPYFYLGYTNHTSGVVLFEKPDAWTPYRKGSWADGKVCVLFTNDSVRDIPEQQLRDWGVWPTKDK